ncbi:MAG: hypothetical protein JO131_04365 [Gammaproteobacteria bacterium]|nr:hypothetical protein [Gammaproteobacteria bacterium]
MANFNYNKKFNEILRLEDQYKRSVDSGTRQHLAKQIKQEFKELNQNIDKTDKKAIADIKKFSTILKKQFGAFKRFDEELSILQNVVFGNNSSNISEDEIQRELNIATDRSRLEKQNPNYKNFSNAAENDDNDFRNNPHKLANYYLEAAALDKKYGREEDLDLEEMVIGLSPEMANEMREEWKQLNTPNIADNAPDPEKTAKDFDAMAKLFDTTSSAPTTKPFQQIVEACRDAANPENGQVDLSHLTEEKLQKVIPQAEKTLEKANEILDGEEVAKDNAVAELKDGLSKISSTLSGKDKEDLEQLQKKMDAATQSDQGQQFSSPIERAQTLQTETEKLKNIAQTGRKDTGSSREVRNEK